LAAAIKQELGIEATLIPGGGGIFDVEIEGRRIYSKRETGRFPTPEEILAKLV
jgi:selenoprotein W-related protein